MWIKTLELENFRNYSGERIELSQGGAVFTGNNGQGKTNILEAIYYLAALNSWRAGGDADLIHESSEVARVGVEVEYDSGRETRVDLEIGKRSRAFRNRKEVAGRRDIAGIVRATLFSPDDVEIVKGAPGRRRSFMDAFLVQLKPARSGVVIDFNRVLKQRNGLLRSSAGREPPGETLDIWDAQLAKKGAELVAERREALSELLAVAERVYKSASGSTGNAPLKGSYVCSYDKSGFGGADELLSALERARPDEIRRGRTLVGPQRDDLQLLIEGRDSRARASQGEQRTAALALRIAEHECLSAVAGEAGVLLLDDVFSELDQSRSEMLAEMLAGAQSLVTTAGVVPDAITMGASACFVIEGGHVVKEG